VAVRENTAQRQADVAFGLGLDALILGLRIRMTDNPV
jgi:hypothetical protein